MDLFRCPTCLGILADPSVEKCVTCGQRLDRKPPIVLDAAGRPDKDKTYKRAAGNRHKGRRFGSRVDR